MGSLAYKCLFFFVLSSAVFSVTPLKENYFSFGNFLEPLKNFFFMKANVSSCARFSLRRASDPEEDRCYITPGNPESLEDCDFNRSSKTFLVIHGWTVSGLFESWVAPLVEALYGREPHANVIVVDWLATAQDLYPTSARNTESVGKEVARFIDWIEETGKLPVENLHLIGYSLGAHVAGFAGSHTANKVGRITGLDPAGPEFEGAPAHRRLSPDDALFVDAVHTFTRAALGLSIGIQQPVGHVDVYPNGGVSQPGCDLRGAFRKLAHFGMSELSEPVKCDHERAVHLFIESVLSAERASRAYLCGSGPMFDRGVCLRCRHKRCNSVGYGAARIRKGHGARMFTRTRGSTPFRVYHYQLKIHFWAKENRTHMEPTLTVSLYGSRGDAEGLQLDVVEKISVNSTHSFLLVLEADIGELLSMTLRWEEERGYSLSRLKNMILSWFSGHPPVAADIQAHKIRVRVGETQRKMVLCTKDRHARLAEEATFSACKVQ
ncbi:hypothetical protein AAFF_G00275590 [Aldrovandia affinis]|uniref:triacylglycerol lipase n=1 Tax=Aldrovandia affinis TaxID=143900 RepID=A0AAD7RAH4_9TELE|nr:hypothetical protein AAFF_G00275590 [Aldrovandia affinis]